MRLVKVHMKLVDCGEGIEVNNQQCVTHSVWFFPHFELGQIFGLILWRVALFHLPYCGQTWNWFFVTEKRNFEKP